MLGNKSHRWASRMALAGAGVALVCCLAACSSAAGSADAPTLGVANPGQPRDNTPVVLQAEQPGAQVAANNQAVLDYSNSDQGYICAETLVDGKFKVLVWTPDGNRYQYTITAPQQFVTIPLAAGNGNYSVGFFQNISGDNYATLFSTDIAVTLTDPLTPFLYPNQFVDFATGDAAVQLSQQVTLEATSESEAIDAIYSWCVLNLQYDYTKAATVAPGYLPNNANTLASRDGICFDYASLCAAMMRAQRLPCSLEIGYCGQVYHAWITVYTRESGVIRKEFVFNPDTWNMMDPTMDSTTPRLMGSSQFRLDPNNYHPLFNY